MASLTPEERKALASNAVKQRWARAAANAANAPSLGQVVVTESNVAEITAQILQDPKLRAHVLERILQEPKLLFELISDFLSEENADHRQRLIEYCLAQRAANEAILKSLGYVLEKKT
jgi:hypothetical protein